jgi:hypothetical protein
LVCWAASKPSACGVWLSALAVVYGAPDRDVGVQGGAGRRSRSVSSAFVNVVAHGQ